MLAPRHSKNSTSIPTRYGSSQDESSAAAASYAQSQLKDVLSTVPNGIYSLQLQTEVCAAMQQK
jgi:predicted Zn-dependent protease